MSIVPKLLNHTPRNILCGSFWEREIAVFKHPGRVWSPKSLSWLGLIHENWVQYIRVGLTLPWQCLKNCAYICCVYVCVHVVHKRWLVTFFKLHWPSNTCFRKTKKNNLPNKIIIAPFSPMKVLAVYQAALVQRPCLEPPWEPTRARRFSFFSFRCSRFLCKMSL